MNKIAVKSYLSAVSSLVVIVAVIVCISIFFVSSGTGNMEVSGAACFRFFTIDSNILAAVACALTLPFTLRRRALSHWATLLKFVGTTAVMVTFFTVMLFLGPTMGYDKVLLGTGLWLHLICPLLCLVSLLFFENHTEITLPEALLGVVPTVLYGVVYIICVLVLGVWKDFYGFNVGGGWPISATIMFLGSVLLAMGIWWVRDRLRKGGAKKATPRGVA